MEKISDYAFLECALESVHFEEGSKLRRIERQVFQGCSSLSSIVFPASIRDLSEHTFNGSSLETIRFEEDNQLSNMSATTSLACPSFESAVANAAKKGDNNGSITIHSSSPPPKTRCVIG